MLAMLERVSANSLETDPVMSTEPATVFISRVSLAVEERIVSDA